MLSNLLVLFYAINKLNPETFIYKKSWDSTEDCFKVPDIEFVRIAEFSKRFRKLLDKITDKGYILSTDMNKICILVDKYKMWESSMLYWEVNKIIGRYFRELEVSECNTVNYSSIVIEIMSCLQKTFLVTKGEQSKVLSLPNEESINKICEILMSAKKKIYLCLDQLTNK